MFLICILIFSLFSCNNSQPKNASIYETLSEMYTKNNSLVNVEIEAVTNGEKLTSAYEIKKEVIKSV